MSSLRPESLSNLLRVTQVVRDRAGTETKQRDPCIPALFYYSAEKEEPRTLPEIHIYSGRHPCMPDEQAPGVKVASKGTELFWTIDQLFSGISSKYNTKSNEGCISGADQGFNLNKIIL